MNFKHIIYTVFFLFLSAVSISAPPPPPGTGPSCWPPPCIPIDGGITMLMAAGAAYGVKKIYDSKKKREIAE